MADLDGDAGPGRSRGAQTKLYAGVACIAVALLFAALNFDEVEVNWIVGTFQTPLIIVIAVSFVLGAAVGALAARRRSGAT